MPKYNIVSAFLSLVLFVSTAHTQENIKTYTMAELVVTATRLNGKFAGTRNSTLLDREAIERLPAATVADLLNYALGVSMNSRGIPGVQSDPSLRGAGFEQVLVLVDGVRMNDSQTGHHNMNVPVRKQDIERIEVLRGQSSALYGPDAFGGTINIITKNARRDPLQVSMRGGSFGTYALSGSVSMPQRNDFATAVSFERSRSDGYRDGTDFDARSAALKSDFRKGRLRLTAIGGINAKDFGARDFYVKGFDHYEETRAYTGGLSGSVTLNSRATLKAVVHHKRHDDYFLLSRTNPGIYAADHTTGRTIFETSGNVDLGGFGELTAGMERTEDSIESTTLGSHDMNRTSFFAEYGRTFGNDLLMNGGIRLDRHSVWGTEVNPSVSAGYVFSQGLLLNMSFGRSFRAPTFTELFSPAVSGNAGDAALQPEQAYAFDTGIDYTLFSSRLKGSTTCFLREQSETIDWIRESESEPWRAVNIFDIRSQGIEQQFIAAPHSRLAVTINYTYLDQNKKQRGFISKYALIHPKHVFSLAPALAVSDRIAVLPVVTYKDRPALNSYWVLDLRATYDRGRMRFFCEGLNLTGSDYREIRDVPMPGAAVYAGIDFSY